MCHIDFHTINTTLHNYLLDQNYFTFCSKNEKEKIDRKNYKSTVLRNDCRERFVSKTVLHNRKRDIVKRGKREHKRQNKEDEREHRNSKQTEKR